MRNRSPFLRVLARSSGIPLLICTLASPLVADGPPYRGGRPVPVGSLGQHIPFDFGQLEAVPFAAPQRAFARRGFARRDCGSYGASPAYAFGPPGLTAEPRYRRVPAQPVAAPPQPIIIINQAPAPAPAYVPPVAAVRRPPARNPNARVSAHLEPGEVFLWIEQSEARVRLDDDSLGTGEDVSSLDTPLRLPAGVHVLVVEHPDYGAERLVFAVPAAEELLIEVNLSGDRKGRKARLRSASEVESRLRILGH